MDPSLLARGTILLSASIVVEAISFGVLGVKRFTSSLSAHEKRSVASKRATPHDPIGKYSKISLQGHVNLLVDSFAFYSILYYTYIQASGRTEQQIKCTTTATSVKEVHIAVYVHSAVKFRVPFWCHFWQKHRWSYKTRSAGIFLD